MAIAPSPPPSSSCPSINLSNHGINTASFHARTCPSRGVSYSPLQLLVMYPSASRFMTFVMTDWTKGSHPSRRKACQAASISCWMTGQ